MVFLWKNLNVPSEGKSRAEFCIHEIYCLVYFLPSVNWVDTTTDELLVPKVSSLQYLCLGIDIVHNVMIYNSSMIRYKKILKESKL